MPSAELKMYIGVVEYGTLGNPISFGDIVAGSIVEHPSNPFYLWNDYGGSIGSVPAKIIEATVFDMWIEDEVMGTSDGSPDQFFTCAVIPVIDNDDPTEILVTVGTIVWQRVPSLASQSALAEVYEFDSTTGVVTFGDNAEGKIPTTGLNIKITYMPDTLPYGKEIFEETWLEIKSLGVTVNDVIIIDEQKISTDLTHVTIANPVIQSVQGVWLQTDPTHVGTNFFTSGSFDANLGVITLGSNLPSLTSPVLVSYTYRMSDDLESDYSPIGLDTVHTFENQIPKNNAKLIYLRLNIPSDAQPSGGSNVNFRLRLTYRE